MLHDVYNRRLKDTFKQCLWGADFSELGIHFFDLIESTGKKPLSTVVKRESTFKLALLQCVDEADQFVLEEIFLIQLTNSHKQWKCTLNENAIWKAIYTDERVYTMLSKPTCIILDVVYSKGGSEAIAESYYSVMNKQQMSGGQSNSTLESRTIIDWSFPDLAQADNAIKAVSKLYLHGAEEHELRKHRIPIFFDQKGRALCKYKTSKVVDRHAKADCRLPFLSDKY